MRSVRSTDNKSTEKKLIQIFRAEGITGWRRSSTLFGKPDFIFPKSHVAVFTDGCFWHGHNCRGLTPKEKLVTRTLENKGWKVIRVWECEINPVTVEKKLSKVLRKS
jgi:DNA mismatch endonuclease (patch repair protein)